MSKYSLPEFYKAYSYLKRMKKIENANAFLQTYFCEQQDFLVFRAMNYSRCVRKEKDPV